MLARGSSEDFWPVVEWCTGYLCLGECIFSVLMDRLEEKGARRGLDATIGSSGGMGWEFGKGQWERKVDSRDRSKKDHVSRT